MTQFSLLLNHQSGELPFVIRSRHSTNWFFHRWKLGSIVLRRNFLVFLFIFLVLGFFYVQFLKFPGQLQLVDQSAPLNSPVVQESSNRIKSSKVEAKFPGESAAQLAVPNVPMFKGPTNDRQKAVRDAFLHAWRGYRQYAWGHDHLKPVSRSYSEWMDCGLTIIDSLDTMLIMGIKEEFEEAKSWVSKELSFEKNRIVNLFETTIRVLGGLLSAFHLSGEKLFLDKAEDIGRRLLSGMMSSPSHIPFSDVNLLSATGKQPSWGGDSSLSEVTSLQLEFRDLSRALNNDSYENTAFRISEKVHGIGCERFGGLCGMFLSPNDGTFRESSTITFGARADSYYEYLLKQWLQTGKTIPWLIEDYKRAMDSMHERLWRESKPNGLGFVGELLNGNNFSPKMDHLVCFLAATLALGAQNGLPQLHMELAKNLSYTCHRMYDTPTGLGPEIAHFNLLPGAKTDMIIKPLDSHSLLRPEAFEAWFYMYRITGDKQYQEWGWKAFEAIERHAKVESGGYSSVNNIKKIPVTHRDMMESFFLSETLKYLYLLLADDQTILPLNRYVFNTEGHPLPIHDK